MKNTNIKEHGVKDFFTSYSETFDNIYETKNHTFLERTINNLLRKDMKTRFDITLSNLKHEKFNSILDIGCGSGRYCLELLKLNKKVTGIDFSDSMIKIAERYCEKHNNNSRFIVDDYLKCNFKEKFDAAILIGFMDYIQKPEILLSKLSKDINHLCIFSFPKKYHYLSPQRIIRYKLRKCPLYLYKKKDVVRLAETCSKNYQIINNDREFILLLKLNE